MADEVVGMEGEVMLGEVVRRAMVWDGRRSESLEMPAMAYGKRVWLLWLYPFRLLKLLFAMDHGWHGNVNRCV